MGDPNILIEALELISLEDKIVALDAYLTTPGATQEHVLDKRLDWINKHKKAGDAAIITGSPSALCGIIARKALKIWKTQTKQ